MAKRNPQIDPRGKRKGVWRTEPLPNAGPIESTAFFHLCTLLHKASIIDVSESTGIPKGEISRIMTGKRGVGLAVIEGLARVHGLRLTGSADIEKAVKETRAWLKEQHDGR